MFRRLVDLLARPLGPDLFQRGIEALCVLLEATYGAVVLKDDKGQAKETIFAGTTPGSSRNLQTFLKQRRPLVDQVLDTQEPLILENIPAYLNSISFPLGHPIMHTFIGVPISREDECFGCIYLCGEFDNQQFTEQDELVVTSFSQTLALVISQAKDRNERKRLLQEREVLSQLAFELSAVSTFDGVSDSICKVTKQVWQWQTCDIYIRKSGNSRFHYLNVSQKDYCKESTDERDFDLSHLPEHKIFEAGIPVITDTPSGLPDTRLLVPIRIEDDEMALLDVVASASYPFTDADKNFARRLADIISPTLARCQAVVRNHAFLSLAFRLTAATTAEEAARIISGTADELLTWDSCSVVLHHPELQMWQGILHMDIINGVRQNVFNPYPVLSPPSPTGLRTMVDGPQLILRDPASLKEVDLNGFGDTTRRSLSLMFVPFRVGSVVGGVFSIQSYTPYAYNEKDLQLLQALADYCAGAVDRIRLAQGIPDPIDYAQPELTPRISPSESSNKSRSKRRQ